MRIRLWTWWQGPDGLLPPGEEVDVEPAVAMQLLQSERAEVVRDTALEVAVATVRERAVRRKRKRK